MRGVTYGTFRPDAEGQEYAPERTERDFALIAANGFNAVRTYTVPPRWLLDAAFRHGLAVMIGVPWEQHVAFLDDRARARSIVTRVRAGVAACAGHPAVLAYAVGNEIPAPIVRWHGRRAIERFLGELADTAKNADPSALVTYVNYPSTEYLDPPSVDLLCFNVYLESENRLAAYLARLHNLAGNRPLMLAEIGLSSRQHGEVGQARALEWQVRAAFASGCAGAFVFAWTDEWHRGGHDVEDWDFGLTDRRRRPKPALATVRRAMAAVPVGKPIERWPRISVVVCTYNGARTIRDCLDGLTELDYPDFEVIVVDDGSTDGAGDIAGEYPVRVIRTPNRGLSNARNTGLAAATGEIVAYTDDDARPDPHWLRYLAATFTTTSHAGVGGPNIPPSGDGWIAECVANAPGGPMHVLVSDGEAEHIPGCNMAFRRSSLNAIGGFDPRFRTAGDDVDVCWRLRDRGLTLGFNPGAVVLHHRRNSVRAYVWQQRSYGRAEALLEQTHPERYNALGHTTWAGQLYGLGLVAALGRRQRIYHGSWGSALFQSIYQPAPSVLSTLAQMPEWYLAIAVLAALSLLGGVAWRPLLAALPVLALAVSVPLIQAVMSASAARIDEAPRRRWPRFRSRLLIAAFHIVQPLARLAGRIEYGLTPWRERGLAVFALPRPRSLEMWTETWREPPWRLRTFEVALRDRGFVVARGGHWDRWDLEVRGGALGAARLLMATEEHGTGRQMWRFRVWPRWSMLGALAVLTPMTLGAAAVVDGAWATATVFAGVGLALLLRALGEAGTAVAAFTIAQHAVATVEEGAARVRAGAGAWARTVRSSAAGS